MRSADVMVVGGGVVGAALAYGWARMGLRVAVLDEGDRAFRASRGTFGMIGVQGKGFGVPAYARWTRTASDLWDDFAAELGEVTGVDVGFRRPGLFYPCIGAEAFEARVRLVRQVEAEPGPAGEDYEILDGETARAFIPALGPEIAGGTFCPHDAETNPLYLLRALHVGIRRHGGAFLPGRRVSAIAHDGSAFRVTAGGEPFAAPRLLLAAGHGLKALAPLVGVEVPIHPDRGEIIATERLAPLLPTTINGIRQTAEGSMLLGQTSERAGFDEGTSLRVTGSVADYAVRVLPCLAAARAVRVWGSLRVMTPDHLPVYEESPRWPGAFVVTCHSGVTLASAHALRLAAALIEARPGGRAGGGVPEALSGFATRRFDVPQAA